MPTKIKIKNIEAIKWPTCCALCCKEIISKDETEIPYCEKCKAKINKLQHWKDNIFGISLVFGIIGAILCLIGSIIEGNIHVYIIIVVVTVGLFSMGISYAVIYILLLPLRLIFHSKLAAPGVKIKIKSDGTCQIKFANAEYAGKFKELNTSILTKYINFANIKPIG